jgi:hypothetical protein
MFSEDVSPSKKRNIFEKAVTDSENIRVRSNLKEKLIEIFDKLPEEAEDNFVSGQRATRTYGSKKVVESVLKERPSNINTTPLKDRVFHQLSSPCKVVLTDICVQPTTVFSLEVSQNSEVSRTESIDQNDNEGEDVREFKRIRNLNDKKANRSPSLENNGRPTVQKEISDDQSDVSPGKTYKRILSFDEKKKASMSPSKESNRWPEIKEEIISPYKIVTDDQSDVSPGKKYKRILSFDEKKKASLSPSSTISNDIGESSSILPNFNEETNDGERIRIRRKQKRKRTRCYDDNKEKENERVSPILQVNRSCFESPENGSPRAIKEEFNGSPSGEVRGNVKSNGVKTRKSPKRQSVHCSMTMEDAVKKLVDKKVLISHDLLDVS